MRFMPIAANPSPPAHRWLLPAELNPLWLTTDSSLSDAVDLFQRDTDLRLLPIIDRDRRPLGAIFEKNVRRLLLNPFGHALLQNPSYGSELTPHMRVCPVHEITDDFALLVDHYRRTDGREGMILTAGGRLLATLSNRRLLLLAAESEHLKSRARLERATRIEQAGENFETIAAALASQMVQLADTVQGLAEATVERSTNAGNYAAEVAAAAAQTRDNLGHVAVRGDSLANAFADIELNLAKSRETASSTAERVSEGSSRARELLEAAQSIDQVMALVNDIASTVNLLSLNATIEAARAGEAGRGFAVVAGEIRSLSDQTQDATLTISNHVQNLRSGIAAVARDYHEVEGAIGTMVERSRAIDSAISSEGDTTRIIASTVVEASATSNVIEESVAAIVQSVRLASSSARELDQLASQLREDASIFDSNVGAFLSEIRAA